MSFSGAQQARVLHPYAAQAANQISLQPGQTITISSHGGKGGWSSGQEINTGVFFGHCIFDWLHEILTL
jgi:hypothetical protein